MNVFVLSLSHMYSQQLYPFISLLRVYGVFRGSLFKYLHLTNTALTLLDILLHVSTLFLPIINMLYAYFLVHGRLWLTFLQEMTP